ncbi:MAG TPA: amino acid adenylation domain-containing protein, partial [Thermoanaerobaculia bacterium]|nr:amino acid adenylation domain-containing protein [Thermoanaerobaculia bacterium]
EYATSLFDTTSVERLIGHFERLLAAAVSKPDTPLPALALLSPEERGQIVAEWNDTATVSASRACLYELFGAQVRRTPEAVAVVFGNQELTYAELGSRVDRLAGRLRRLGVGPDVLVGLLVERSLDMIVGVLGILQAGGAYVPLDPQYPAQRLAFMLEDTRCPVLLTQTRLRHRLPDGNSEVLLLDIDKGTPAGSATPPAGEPAADNLAYVIYTSGSTGRPKGVALSRGALRNLIDWHLTTLLGGARTLQFASLSFDASFHEMFACWGSGGTLVVVQEELRRDMPALAGLLVEQQIEKAVLPVVVLQQLGEIFAGQKELPPLREITTTGERLQTNQAMAALLRRLPGCAFHNHYGPSETHVATAFTLRPDPEDWTVYPSIGRPIENSSTYVFEPGLMPAPIGVPGDLYIGGDCLARGYLRRPDLTAQKFVPDPFGAEPGARLYRTGDKVRLLADGNLEYLGRFDDLVKIRGFRIEPGEIEALLLTLPGVREAAVVAREDRERGPGDRRLVAYVVGDVAADALRRLLHERLPDYMVPATFVPLAALPLTPNGKVDRKALPTPEWQRPEEGWQPPRTPVEEVLAGIWAEVLGFERVGSADHFFNLGGHSLLATQVMSRLRSAFDVEMPLRDLFEAPVLADLAARVETARRSGAVPPAPPLVSVPREGPLPLSSAQQRLWFIDQLEPGSPLYNIPVALRIEGPLHHAVLRRCLSEIVRRHEVLRTVFAVTEGPPVQVIRPAEPVGLSVVDLAGLPVSRRQAKAFAMAGEEARRPFDLTRGPLLRGVLLRIAEGDHVVALTMHHIVSDGWSLGILVREVTALYAAFAETRPSPLPELPVQYADFAVWQHSWLQGEILEGEIAFWRRQLAGLPPLLELPTDRPRPAAQSFRGASRPVRLPVGLTQQIEALSRRQGVTVFMVLLAGFEALLSRYSGQQDLAIGTPVAGRNRTELEGLIGFFVNTLVLRGDLTGEPTFRELLGRVRETALAAHAHQDVPFEKLVQELSPERSLAQTPLFQVMFVLQNAPVESLEIQNLRLRPVSGAGTTAKFDLELSLGEWNGGLRGAVEYATDLFDTATMDRLLVHYESLLTAAVATPELMASELPLLSPAERHQLLSEWNDTAVPASRRLLSSLFKARVACTPHALASTYEGESLTYAQLGVRAERVASHLRQLGCGPESRVGVALERTLDLLVAFLGVLEAGAVYVPLDPEYPRERLAYLLQDSRPSALLTQESVRDRLPLPPDLPVLLPTALPAMDTPSDLGAPEDLGDHLLAYVLYTSGSTGRPKGAQVAHAGMVNHLQAKVSELGLDGHSRVAQTASQCFDISVWQLLAPLLAGGSVHIADQLTVHDPELLLRFVARERITVLEVVPSLLGGILESLRAAGTIDLSSLQWMIVTGEACPQDLADRWLELAPHTRLLNAYGPTECSDDVTHFERAAPAVQTSRSLPIGKPIANTRIYLLDPQAGPTPQGVAGEICVAGRGVGRGYLDLPERTAQVFVPDPSSVEPGARLYRTGDLGRWLPTGILEFLGRLDHQVKVRGFRIELGEIEGALAAQAGIREAVVVTREDTPGDRRLVAYV